jgi:hypothetical protein
MTMTSARRSARLVIAAIVAAAASVLSAEGAPQNGKFRTLAGVACETPPPDHCGEACAGALLANPGNATEPKSGRKFFLDYPCDLKPGEPIVFILSLHGAGSIGNWQRHYFPAMDFKEKYRLVIATPTAATSGSITSGGPAVRMWTAAADDRFLHDVVDYVFEQVGRQNLKAFWLAGHSQGGMTSNRIVCTDFFRDKVDGWLSLSGGRIGPAQIAPDFFGPSGPPASLSTGDGPRPGVAAIPACDLSYIFTSGEHEITALPETSPWAQKYECGARVRRTDVVDTAKGYVTGAAPGRGKSWGLAARPGTAEVFVYPNCKGGKVVADVLRMDKGHTEGLEPKVTESLIKMMVSAKGGKARTAKTAATTARAIDQECDRECLRGFVTQYLNAMVTHAPGALHVAPDVRFTEDTVDMKLGEGLWKQASKVRAYRLDILDVAQGVAASQTVVEEAGSPVMLMLRLKITDKKIAEVETQVTRSQKEGAIFVVDALLSPNAAMIKPVDPGKRSSRADAIKIAEFYPAGLEAGSFVTVDAPFAADAYRFENGRLMAGKGCEFRPPSCEDIKGQTITKHPGLSYRVVAVDEELGITLLRMNFGPAEGRYGEGNGLIVWEAFKVYDGQIHGVEAFMKIMPVDKPSGWDTDVRRPVH